MFRRQLVGMLSAEGMTTRAIAPAMGVSQPAISQMKKRMEDADSNGDVITPVITPQAVSPVSAPSAPKPDQAPVRKVTGLDGKKYSATKPNAQQDNKPKRRPLTDQFREATLNITRDCNRLERLTTDDRFKKAVNVHDVSSVKWTLERLEKVAQAFESVGVTE